MHLTKSVSHIISDHVLLLEQNGISKLGIFQIILQMLFIEKVKLKSVL